MAPGSRGAGAVFVCFSGEDSGQTGDASGEPRVARRSRSHYLSNAPGLAGQLALPMSDFNVLGTVGKLALPNFARFQIRGNPSLGSRDMVPRPGAAGVFLVRSRTVFRSRFRLDPLPISDFDDLGIVGKLVLPTSQRYRPCTGASLGSQDMILRTEAVGMFLMPRGHFLIEIPARPEELLTIRKLHVVAEVILLLKGLSLWTNFVHNPLVSRPFLARKVSNRSSHHALQNGQGAEMYPGPPFEGFWARWTLFRSGTARSNLGQHLVKPWSKLPDFWEMCPGPCSEVIWCDKPSSDQAALVRAASFCMPTPEKIPWVSAGAAAEKRRSELRDSSSFCGVSIRFGWEGLLEFWWFDLWVLGFRRRRIE
uniref:Uncharacterized protein n=1 Tax=Fagus sylvatica TaxID=28930 RepID=A0A2N9FT26_FAGSY